MITKRIYARSMAEYLVENGCRIIQVTQDIINPNFCNWIFEDSDLLRIKMAEFTTLYAKGAHKK